MTTQAKQDNSGFTPREKARLAAKRQADKFKRAAPAASRPTRSSTPKLQERASKGTANVRLKEQLTLSTRPVKRRVSAPKSRPLNGSTTVIDDNETLELEVDHIAAKGLAADGSVLYQVRWRGYGEADDTWEPLENLNGAKKAIQLFENDAQGLDSAGEPDGSIKHAKTSKAVTQRARKQSSLIPQVRICLYSTVLVYFHSWKSVCRPVKRTRVRLVQLLGRRKRSAGP